MSEGFTSVGFVWVWLVRFWVFGSDFFRVSLGLAEGLTFSGLLWRRASLLRQGFLGFVLLGVCWVCEILRVSLLYGLRRLGLALHFFGVCGVGLDGALRRGVQG